MSSITPRCYRGTVTGTLRKRNTGIINHCRGWDISFALRLKITFWACLVASGLKFTFQWKAHLFIISKSLLRSFANTWVLCSKENKEVWSANSFVFVVGHLEVSASASRHRHWHQHWHWHRHSNINIVFYTVQIAFRVKI